jgi:hypothetical protein
MEHSMKTDELIRVIAADRTSAPSVQVSLAVALAAGMLASATLFGVELGPRGDVLVAAGDPRFLSKFVVTAVLAATSAWTALALARPGAGFRGIRLALAPGLLAVAVLVELALVPAGEWTARAVGSNSLVCLVSVPMLAAPVLVAVLWALRRAAPTRPMLAGAVAGLIAGGMGAMLYAAHCTDDSPLFVALWYSLAIAPVAAVGALAGRFVLRW